MTRFALQFGQTQPGLTYVERTTAYGLCNKGDQIAIARIGLKAPFEYDLPGGGVEADEDEAAALMREFQEETGLTVWPTRVIGRAGQFWMNNKIEPRNSLATFYEVELSAEDGDPTEPDHVLIWLSAADAVLKVRHEAHAWAILHWLRMRRLDK
jgi:8-oxo-dGTP diphosphatase